MKPMGRPRPHGGLLAIIAASGTLAMHMLVPALPAVAREFETTAFTAQLTLFVYLVGVAAGQLIYGPLSDRFGRRPVLLASLTLFLLASMVAAFASSIQWLIVARVVQAIGACGGLVLGRAMARDGTTLEDAARQLAILVMAMTVAPAIAPLLGGTVATWLGWRAIFALLSIVGAVVLLLTLFALPETSLQRTPLPGVSGLLAIYRGLLSRPKFCAYAIGGSCMSTSIYAFLAASPFLFSELLHRTPEEVGLYYLAVIAGITLGSWLASQLTVPFGVSGVLQAGATFGMAGSIALLLLHVQEALGAGSLLGTMCVFAIGAGMTSPVATAQAISVDPERIGAASGLYGFLQMSFGALCTLLVGLWNNSVLAVGVILVTSATIAQVAFSFARYFVSARGV